MKHFLLLSLFFLFGSLNVSAQSTPTPESEITSLASAVAEIERLQSEIQRLRGELERQNFLLSKIEQDSKTIQQDVMMSTRSLEEKFQLYRDALQRALANVSPALAKETAKFEKGLDQANAAEYAGAIQTFEQFLKEYPKSPQREMAHFWIAECRFSTREFSQAIKDYQKFIEKYPQSKKIPTALLNQGNSFTQLQMNNEAAVFFEKLIKEHPSSPEAKVAAAQLASLRNNKSEPTAATPQVLDIKPAEPKTEF